VLSLFDKFLKYTTTFESDSDDKSGGSETYDSADDATPNACGEGPKPVKLEAAFALLACDFAVRLLMVGSEELGGLWGSCGRCSRSRKSSDASQSLLELGVDVGAGGLGDVAELKSL
jgi:hypothetical protein